MKLEKKRKEKKIKCVSVEAKVRATVPVMVTSGSHRD